MALSNLISVGSAQRNFTCTFDQAVGGYAGSIKMLLDQQYLMINFMTADKIWAAIKSIADPDEFPIVYAAVLTPKSGGVSAYVGKTKTNLKTRYADSGPNSGGLQQVFNLYTSKEGSLDITIYGTTHPCFIEGWCFQVAQNRGYTLTNILDPN